MLAVSIHRQRLPRLLARLPVLFRPAHPRVPGSGFRHGLRHPGCGEDECRRRAATRAVSAVVAAGDGGARYQHRPVSAGRGTLRAHAGNHCRADRFRYAFLDPDQGHAVAPRSAVDHRGRHTRRRQRGGVAGRRRSRTAQGCRAGHADTPGPTRAHLRHPRGGPGLSRHGRPGTAASDGFSGASRLVVGPDRRGGSNRRDGVRAAPEGFDARMVHGMARAVPSRTGVGVPRVVPARSVSAVGLQEVVARQGDSVDRQARPGSGSPVVSCCPETRSAEDAEDLQPTLF